MPQEQPQDAYEIFQKKPETYGHESRRDGKPQRMKRSSTPDPGTEDERPDTGTNAGAGEGTEAGAGTRVGPGDRVRERAPDRPTDLPKRSWRAVLRGTVREFRNDELADRAAALTYYGVLAIFPALLVLVSLLGIAGESTTQRVLDNLRRLAPGSVRDVISDAVMQLQGRSGIGSLVAVVGLVVALWSASGYVAAFIRASNAVYDVPEGRSVWKILPLRLAPDRDAHAPGLCERTDRGVQRRAGPAGRRGTRRG